MYKHIKNLLIVVLATILYGQNCTEGGTFGTFLTVGMAVAVYSILAWSDKEFRKEK